MTGWPVAPAGNSSELVSSRRCSSRSPVYAEGYGAEVQAFEFRELAAVC